MLKQSYKLDEVKTDLYNLRISDDVAGYSKYAANLYNDRRDENSKNTYSTILSEDLSSYAQNDPFMARFAINGIRSQLISPEATLLFAKSLDDPILQQVKEDPIQARCTICEMFENLNLIEAKKCMLNTANSALQKMQQSKNQNQDHKVEISKLQSLLSANSHMAPK